MATVTIHKVRVQFLVECDVPAGTEFAGLYAELHKADERIVDTYITCGQITRRIIEVDLSLGNPWDFEDDCKDLQMTIIKVISEYKEPSDGR